MKPAALRRCQAGQDGECCDKLCPQVRDDEPTKSGRFCPLPTGNPLVAIRENESMPTKPTAHPAAPKKNVRARLMIENPQDGLLYDPAPGWPLGKWPKFYVLPATAEAFDALVEQMAVAAFCEEHADHTEKSFYRREEWERGNYRDTIKAALLAIGIQPAARVARSRRDA